MLSCPENQAVYYGNHGTRLVLGDDSKCILENVRPLSWEKGAEGLESPWAGALQAALAYMGEPYTYEQIMGMSGACYRTCFTDVWDYSCTDALVAYDYATPLYSAIGYGCRMVERLEKQERKAERQAIMEDIRRGRPVLAINLRVAPEWGVITGYTDNGNRFLCRTYFDQEVFDALESQMGGELKDGSGTARKDGQGQTDGDARMKRRAQSDYEKVFEENGGYLYSDFWPFLIAHFGEKGEGKSPMDILKASLAALIGSFEAEESRGYHQGRDAYRAWIKGLSREEDFRLEQDRENVQRRLSVNDSMLGTLVDSRRAAAAWLRENLSLVPETGRERLERMADNCQAIADGAAAFRTRLSRSSVCEIAYNTVKASGASTSGLRREQIALLEQALSLEEENCQLAREVLGICG